MNERIGRKLRDMREERGLTQGQVAERLAMSRQKYARIENGVSDITLEVLSKLAAVYDVNVSDITSVLDEETVMAYRIGEGELSSVKTVCEMVDLFYANKHVYDRIHYRDAE